VSARLLGVRRFGTAKAAQKRYQQDDFQHVQLANGITRLSAGLRGPAAVAQAPADSVPKLRLLHYSQIVFGRLDQAWQQAVQQQQKLQSQQQES
jgi:hypothetical protein